MNEYTPALNGHAAWDNRLRVGEELVRFLPGAPIHPQLTTDYDPN